MSYRRAWLLVEQINETMREHAVTTASGGHRGGGTKLTAVGERVIELYRAIEDLTADSARPAVGNTPGRQFSGRLNC